MQWFQRAIQRARDEHDLLALCFACADYGGNYSFVGDVQVALAHAQQGVEIAEKAGRASTRAYAYAQLARAYLRVGSYAEAVASSARSIETIRRSHTVLEFEPYAAAPLAEAYAYIGESDRALRTAEESVTGAQRRCVGMLPFAQLAMARVLLRTKGPEARGPIEAVLGELSRLARTTKMKTFEPLVCVERAELARLSGDDATRTRELRQAHQLFMEIGAPIRAAEVAKELGLSASA